jgi:hypothetical protein
MGWGGFGWVDKYIRIEGGAWEIMGWGLMAGWFL